MLDLPAPTVALIFLLVCAPFCAHVVWTDLKYMKIRNVTVAGLLAAFLPAGLLLLPLEAVAWRGLNVIVVLGVGFVLHLVARIGAGDVKFAAAAAAWIAPGDAGRVLMLLALMTLLTFVLHRAARALPALRRAAPDWESWRRPDFPLGLALAPTLLIHLARAAV